MMRRSWKTLLVLLCWMPVLALAQLPTSVDSKVVALGETVALSIDAGTAGEPLDTAPLLADFSVLSHRQQRLSELRNGRFVSRVQHVLVLAPHRAGSLVVPALAVGDQYSKPLRLEVRAGAGLPSGASAQAPGHTATWFVQSGLAASAAYVGQPIGLSVAVFLGEDIASGELEVDEPVGGRLQRVGQDQSSRVMHNGQPYLRVERRYLLTPERDGPLSLPPARFVGRQVAGLWSGSSAQVQAAGQPLSLLVRPVPAHADRPWLPLQAARLEWLAVPDRLLAGEGARFELQAELEGGTAAQRDVLTLPPSGPGWQVYAEPVVMELREEGARSIVRLRRSFQLVAERDGVINLPAIELPWWEAVSGQRRVARLPARQLLVLSGNVPAATEGAVQPVASSPPRQRAEQDPARGRLPSGQHLAIALLILFGAAGGLAWWVSRRRRKPTLTIPPVIDSSTASSQGFRMHSPALDQALAQGSVQEVIDALCALGGLADPSQLNLALEDPAQRQVLLAAERAWWVPGGDRVLARKALQQAFSSGPRWKGRAAAIPVDTLPPLYPPHRA